MCQVNTVPMRSQVGYLDVVFPPQILVNETSDDVVATEGANVTLTCKARGYPTPDIHWKREDKREIPLQTQLGKKYAGELRRATRAQLAREMSTGCVPRAERSPRASFRQLVTRPVALFMTLKAFPGLRELNIYSHSLFFLRRLLLSLPLLRAEPFH